jgi:hypothetical protein
VESLRLQKLYSIAIQLRTLNCVVKEKCGSEEEFGKSMINTGRIMNQPSYWMYGGIVNSYLSGRRDINPRPARAMYVALDRDNRIQFIYNIGKQRLVNESTRELDVFLDR